jgi:hypothetical protein
MGAVKDMQLATPSDNARFSVAYHCEVCGQQGNALFYGHEMEVRSDLLLEPKHLIHCSRCTSGNGTYYGEIICLDDGLDADGGP